MSRKLQRIKIGKDPVVVLPVSFWESICNDIEELREHYEMSTSENYKKAIAAARKSKKYISSNDVAMILKIGHRKDIYK